MLILLIFLMLFYREIIINVGVFKYVYIQKFANYFYNISTTLRVHLNKISNFVMTDQFFKKLERR